MADPYPRATVAAIEAGRYAERTRVAVDGRAIGIEISTAPTGDRVARFDLIATGGEPVTAVPAWAFEPAEQLLDPARMSRE